MPEAVRLTRWRGDRPRHQPGPRVVRSPAGTSARRELFHGVWRTNDGTPWNRSGPPRSWPDHTEQARLDRTARSMRAVGNSFDFRGGGSALPLMSNGVVP